ncbi:glycosyltransferase family 2 protein [Thermomonas paludicola]|uniref:glycosyltransferase family 2 protein n=1 Tax=Thermomonas paludicola TaxID=2884874 RepID=UPI0021152A1B|nr:glycosyltransferase family 2 protein [Thermomonas paludicola]
MNGGGIAVIVVSCNSEETIDECLTRLRAAAGVSEIRVVDNASTDSTLEHVQRHALRDRRLRFIANPDNPGFAVACNQGARASDAPWLAFVNPDCFLDTDSLLRLLAHAEPAGQALLGANLVNEAGVPDVAARRRDAVFSAMLRPPWRTSLAVPADAALALQRVDAVSGALLLLPRALFLRIDGFDEGYRLHVEDLDLCRRARAAGAMVACANDVRVLHVRGVSSRSRPVFVEWHKHRGLWRYFRKFEAAGHGFAVRAAVFVLIWARCPLAILRAAVGARGATGAE